MSGVTTTYSSVSTITEHGLSVRVIHSVTGPAYTCPPETIAKIRGSMVLDSIGSDATYAIAVNRAASPDVYHSLGARVTPGGASVISGYVILGEGDKLTMIGDDGSVNGSGDIDISIQEVSGG